MRRVIAAGAVLGLSVAGCGGSREETHVATRPKTEAQAEAYALDVVKERTGQREVLGGCLSATKVEGGEYKASPEAEANPGCIYSAALGGCLEGQLGRQISPR